MSTPVLFFVDDLAEAVPVSTQPYHQVDPGAPELLVTDLGPTRGDGIFEVASVVNGNLQALSAHLARFANSAKMSDLPAPKLEVWRAAMRAAVAAHAPVAEASAKIVMTRGIEGIEVPTGWVYVDEVEPATEVRTKGISVVTLDRGYPHDIAQKAPWLLQGAKTLSYAPNQAALREAARRGADDAVFIATDGFILEGPHASLLLRHGNTITTPSTDQGILKGTTQASAFAFFESRGFDTEYRLVHKDELQTADGLWLVSSVRQAAPFNTLDGVPVPMDAELDAGLNAALLARTE